jgi:hypothetical protein
MSFNIGLWEVQQLQVHMQVESTLKTSHFFLNVEVDLKIHTWGKYMKNTVCEYMLLAGNGGHGVPSKSLGRK